MFKTKYSWPLAVNDFTLWDRLKIAGFFLNKSNRWTQDKYVREYERKIADYVGARYAVFVSSGSAANQLIAQHTKDELIKKGEWPQKNKIVLSSISWQTNASVWLREGFEPIFLDVSLKDFAINEKKLEELLQNKAEEIACVFPTSVLGYTPNIKKYQELELTYHVKFCLDNCENFFGEAIAPRYSGSSLIQKYNINNFFTCSTSGYVAHQLNSGGEMGIIFTNDYEQYKYFILARAHGLSRNLKPYAQSTIYSEMPPWPDINTYYPWEFEPIYNDLVDQEFNFAVLSSNYRNTDIAAYCSLLNFKKLDKNKVHRIEIYNYFKETLCPVNYFLPENRTDCKDVAFCLPIIVKDANKEARIKAVRKFLDDNGIENRAFISCNMLRQTPYKKYGNYKDFENAEYLTKFACYIGLNSSTTLADIKWLTKNLNQL